MAKSRPQKGGSIKEARIKPFKNLNLIDGRYLPLRTRFDPLINKKLKERFQKKF